MFDPIATLVGRRPETGGGCGEPSWFLTGTVGLDRAVGNSIMRARRRAPERRPGYDRHSQEFNRHRVKFSAAAKLTQAR
jgi:hypothetical protein